MGRGVTSHITPNCYRIVQPYGRDVRRGSTTISEHATAADAFAEIDRLAEQMMRTAAKPETVTLLVIDADGGITRRREPPNTAQNASYMSAISASFAAKALAKSRIGSAGAGESA